jgi:hypothetical protein
LDITKKGLQSSEKKSKILRRILFLENIYFYYSLVGSNSNEETTNLSSLISPLTLAFRIALQKPSEA